MAEQRFLVELESVARGQRKVMKAEPGPETLHFDAPTPQQPAIKALTPQQLHDFGYDIEHRVHGLKGMAKEFVLWATDMSTGARQQITYAQACEIMVAIDPDFAAKVQAERDAKALEAKRARSAALAAGGMRGAAVQAVESSNAGGTPYGAVDINLGG